jgi:hypothetical protein
VIPRSMAQSMARNDSASSTTPQPRGVWPSQNGPPMAQHPIPMALTLIPDLPIVRVKVIFSSREKKGI